MLKISKESISEILGIKDHYIDLAKNKDESKVRYYESFRSSKDNLSYPSVVSLNLMDSDEFFADIATYYENFTPLSNTIHIMNDQTFHLISSMSKKKLSDIKSNFILSGFIGLMIGESYTLNNNLKTKNGITNYSWARNSFSFFVARSFYLYDSNLNSNFIRILWSKFSQLFQVEYHDPVVETVIFIKDLLTNSLSKNQFMDLGLIDSIYYFSKIPHEENRNKILKNFIKLYPNLANLAIDIYGPYNNRMHVFNNIISNIEQRSKNFRLDEVAIAFFCNEISPGSYAHYNILKDLARKYPAALVWYGFFSSLSNSYNNSQQSNLFIKLKRDLVEPFSFEDRPTCDISMDEYEILSRISMNNSTLNLSNLNSISVSLLPGVNIDVAINNRDYDSTSQFLNEQAIMLLKEATLILESGKIKMKNHR